MINAFSKNGIIKVKFQAIGAPKMTGSLILKIDGTIVALPTELSLFDLDFNIMSTNGNVPPCPPINTHPQ